MRSDMSAAQRGCKVDGCDREHNAKGYCLLHYRRVVVHGEPGPVDSVNAGKHGLEDSPLWCGISYRQLDYWTRVGYIHAEGGGGSGRMRVWSDDEQRVAERMARLIRAGLRPAAAADYARQPADCERQDVPGVRIYVQDVAGERT